MSVISGRTSKKYLSKKLVVSEKLLHLCTVKEILKSNATHIYHIDAGVG